MRELTILGGGPAGLGVALYAHRAGLRFSLHEKAAAHGGMCRTFRHGEHRHDAGAHRFHDQDPRITRDVRELLGDELRPVRAPSQVWIRGRFVDFPPTPLSAVLSYGVGGAWSIAMEILGARLRPREEATFEDFAHNRFGATLARGLLLDYSEKLWGLPASQLSPDIALRRLRGMTLRSLLVEILLPGRKTAHIDGEFLYPRQGYGAIVDRLVEALPAEALHTGHEVVRLETEGDLVKRVHFNGDRSVAVPGRLVSTLPLTVLVKLLGDAAPEEARRLSARLRFRHVRMIFVRLAQARVSSNASIYIPEPGYCVCRVYEPKNRSAAMAPAHETSLVAEVPCAQGDPIHALSEEALAARVLDELTSIGLVRRERVLEWRHLFLPFAYPVYAVGYEADARRIIEALGGIGNLDTIGRGGGFHYSHLHDQLRFGRDYVAEFLRRTPQRD